MFTSASPFRFLGLVTSSSVEAGVVIGESVGRLADLPRVHAVQRQVHPSELVRWTTLCNAIPASPVPDRFYVLDDVACPDCRELVLLLP
jgi:hypothetical protein